LTKAIIDFSLVGLLVTTFLFMLSRGKEIIIDALEFRELISASLLTTVLFFLLLIVLSTIFRVYNYHCVNNNEKNEPYK